MESHSLSKATMFGDKKSQKERITAWKRLKAGHLGEMTKIFRSLDEVPKDNPFTSEVTELSRHLKDQWAQYCFVYNEIMSHLQEDSERANERNRFNGQTQACIQYSFQIEQFLTCTELQSGGTANVAPSAHEPGISKGRVSFPRDAHG